MSTVLSATRQQQIEWLVSGYLREEIESDTDHESILIPNGVKQIIGNSMFTLYKQSSIVCNAPNISIRYH